MRPFTRRVGPPLLLVFTLGCNDLSSLDLTGPSQNRTVGSGNFITVTRPIDGFDTVDASTGLRVLIAFGAVESLEITAEDNIVPLVETAVVGGRLVLGFKSGAGSINAHGVTCRITARTLRDVRASSGSQIDIEGVAVPSLTANVSSGATLTISGTADRFDFDLSSGSRLHASGLATRVVNAQMSSGSVARIRVADTLIVNATSAAVLEYFGNPVVHAQTSSGATVRSLTADLKVRPTYSVGADLPVPFSSNSSFCVRRSPFSVLRS